MIDAEYCRIRELEGALAYALGIYKSVREMRPDLMPNTIGGAITDVEKLLALPTSTEEKAP